ncbi:MAG: hypothetical protein EBR86_11340 [Planctomycetia bacterium]|nr:hypothetical protein [Planctomycetia bacterium]
MSSRSTTNNTNNFVVNSIAFSGTTQFTLSGTSIALGGNIDTAGTTRNSILNLPINLTTSATFTAGGVSGTQALTIQGVIDNSSGLTLAGTGPTNLTQSITGIGTLTTGTGSTVNYVGVNLGGDLSVGGVLNIGGTNVAATRLVIAGGDMTVSSSNAAISMVVGTSFGAIVDPTVSSNGSYDQFIGVGGSSSVAFNGALNLNMDLLEPDADYPLESFVSKWKLFNFANYSGNFTAMTATGSPYPEINTTWTQDGNGNWVSPFLNNGSDPAQYFAFDRATGELVVVPEPTGFVIAGLGVAMAGWRLARQRKQKAAAARAEG